MPCFGVHISIAGGIQHAPERAWKLGCDAMQIFCRNQRTWKSPPLTNDACQEFKHRCGKLGIKAVSVHSSYLINPGTNEKKKRRKSRDALREELDRTSALSIPYYTIHPGAHRGTGEEACIRRIGEMLDWVLERTPAERIMVLLETTAGQGTSIGHRFEHLRDILAATRYPDRIGVCFDTCHVFAAGYDLRTSISLKKTLAEFNQVVGFHSLHLFHLNDSKGDLGSRIDRHEHIGRGKIGKDGFAALVRQRRFKHFAMLLETPGRDTDDVRNLQVLKNLSSHKFRPRP